MNKIGIYTAYWEKDWSNEFLPYLEKVKTLGFDVIEINAECIKDSTDQEKQKLREEVERLGLSISGCIGTPAEYDIASTDAGVRKAGIEFFKKIYKSLSDIGVDRLSGITYSCWPGVLSNYNGTKEDVLDYSVDSLRELMKYAEDLGLTINVEVLNRFEHFMLNTAAEGVEFCERVGSDNCKILLDTFHMNIEEDDIADAIRTGGDKLGHLHFGESNRKAPGNGHLPWPDIMQAVKDIDYKDFIVFEPFVIPGGSVAEAVSLHRELVPGHDLDRDAAESCEYIRSLF